jgi:uncharacterized membrane protein YphA (DoxX/SURF4 family)
MAAGLIWGIDAAFKLQPNFESVMLDLVDRSGEGQPALLAPWFSFWSATFHVAPGVFAGALAALEISIAFAMVLGLLRTAAYCAGLLLSLGIWAIPEGFGGPYGQGSVDVGAGIVYALLFGALLVLRLDGGEEYAVDRLIGARLPWWRHVG